MMSEAERSRAVARILRMIDTTGIEVTHRVTDDGIEFGFTSQKHADVLRLNLMALEGDFGTHTHTQHLETAEDRDVWMALAAEVSTALGITLDGYIFDDRLEIDFARSEDAIIFREAMDAAWEAGAMQGIALGRGMQRRMTALRADLRSGEPSPP